MAKAEANEELDLDGDEESDYESNSDNDDDDTDNNTDNSDNDDEDDDEDDDKNDNNDEDNNSDAEESNDDHDSDDDDDDDQEHDQDTDPLLSDADDDDDPDASQCPICLMSLTGQQLGTPNNCDHVFCFLCISEWSKNSNTCPVDRKKFGEILVHQTKKGPVTKKVKVEDKHVPNDQEWEQAPTYCEICEQCNREAMMLLCDGCDRGYHMFCLTPRMHLVPEGDWYCDMCLVIRNESIPDVDIPVNQPQTSMDSAPSTSGQATTSSTRGRTASTRARGRGRRRTTTTRRPRSSSTRRKTKKRGRTTSRTTKKTKTKTSKRGRSASATSRRKTTKKKTATRKRKRKTTSKKSPRKKRRRNEDDNTASFMLPSRSSRERLNTSNALSIYGNEFALHDFDANEDVVPKEEKETPPKRSQPSSTDVLSSILDEIEVLHDEDARVSRDGRVLPAKSCGLKSPNTTPPEKTRNSEKSPLKRPSTQSSVEHERPKMKKVSFLDTTSDETEVTRYCPENTSTSETSSTINSHIKCADISNNARQENSSYTHDKILLGSEKYSSERTSKTEKTRFEQNPDNSTDKHPEFASICRVNSEKNNASTSNHRTESPVDRNRISTFQERNTGDINNFQEMLASKHSEIVSTSKDNNEQSNERKLQRNNEFQENPTSGYPQSSSLSRRDCGYSRPSVQAGELQYQSKSRHKTFPSKHRHTSEPDEKTERSHKYDQERLSSVPSKSSTLNDPILTSQLYDTRKPGAVSRNNFASSKTSSDSRMTSYRDVKDQTWIGSGSVCRPTSSPSSIIPTVTSHLDESPSLLHSRSSVIPSAVTTATVTSREKGKKKHTSSRFDISHIPSPPVNTTHQTLSSRFSDYSTAPSVSMTTVTSTDTRQIKFKDKSNKLRVNVAEPERQIITSKPSLSSNFTHHSLPKLKSMNVAPSLPSRPKLKGLVTKHDGKNSPTLNASYPPYKPTDTNYQQNLAIIDMLRSKKSSLKAEIKKETTSEQQKDFNTLFAIDDPLTSPSHGCGESKSLKTAIKSEHDGMLSKAEAIKSSVNVPEFKTLQGQHALETGKPGTNLVQPQTQLHSSYDSYSTLPARCENFHRPKLHSLINNASRPSSLPVAIVKPSRAVENEKVAAKHDGKIDSPTSTAPLLYAAQSTSLSTAEAERVENRKKGIARLQRLSSIKDSVRLALQPFYNHKEITRNEFKDIFVKAVQKVHQSSSPIDFIRISELVKKYVKKYKGRRC